jgi:hypothetical protein
VCLEDRFEVEGESIPQCEFTARRTGQNTPAFWCPLQQPQRNVSEWIREQDWLEFTHHDAIDRTTNFVCRRVDELGA